MVDLFLKHSIFSFSGVFFPFSAALLKQRGLCSSSHCVCVCERVCNSWIGATGHMRLKAWSSAPARETTSLTITLFKALQAGWWQRRSSQSNFLLDKGLFVPLPPLYWPSSLQGDARRFVIFLSAKDAIQINFIHSLTYSPINIPSQRPSAHQFGVAPGMSFAAAALSSSCSQHVYLYKHLLVLYANADQAWPIQFALLLHSPS